MLWLGTYRNPLIVCQSKPQMSDVLLAACRRLRGAHRLSCGSLAPAWGKECEKAVE